MGSREPYIDDQPEIEMIWNICEKLAELARDKCRRTYKTDLTEIYMYLVNRAYEAGYTDRLCSLFDSARRRHETVFPKECRKAFEMVGDTGEIDTDICGTNISAEAYVIEPHEM